MTIPKHLARLTLTIDTKNKSVKIYVRQCGQSHAFTDTTANDFVLCILLYATRQRRVQITGRRSINSRFNPARVQLFRRRLTNAKMLDPLQNKREERMTKQLYAKNQRPLWIFN